MDSVVCFKIYLLNSDLSGGSVIQLSNNQSLVYITFLYMCARLWSDYPGLSPGRGHCGVFLGKTRYSHSASLYPGVQMGTDEFNAGGNPAR